MIEEHVALGTFESQQRDFRLIAIRKDTRSQRRGLGDVGTKRALLAHEGADELAERGQLQELGLTERPLQYERSLEPPPMPTYMPLPLAQSYVIESDSREQLASAQDALGDEFHVMPDIPLALPRPEAGGEKVRAAADGPAVTPLPEPTGIEAARADGIRGAGTIVAIIDTGCDADHAEFVSREIDFLWVPPVAGATSRNVRGFDTVNHGTHVAGIVAGANVGIAPDVELLVVSVIESETVATSLKRIIIGLEWILRRITTPENRDAPVILNLSLGFLREWIAPTEINGVMIGVRLLLEQLIQDYDVLPIVAIGNDGPGTVRAPGYFPEVVSVGAVSSQLEPAPFSGGGMGPPPFDLTTSPDVAGIGVEVLSGTERDGRGDSWYAKFNGTSMATPYVTGIAALVAARTGLQGSELRQHLESSALALPFPEDRVGKGLARYHV